MPIRLRTGLATLMVAIAVLAICFGAFRAGPGLGVLVALFLVPAALRASLHAESRRAEGRPLSWSEKNDSIAMSIMLAILLLPAAGIAFAATCVPIGVALLDRGDFFFFGERPPQAHEIGSPSGVVVAMAAGVVAGILASYLLGRKFWPRKD